MDPNARSVQHSGGCRSRIRRLTEESEEGRKELEKETARMGKRTEEIIRNESLKDPETRKEVEEHDEETDRIEGKKRN